MATPPQRGRDRDILGDLKTMFKVLVVNEGSDPVSSMARGLSKFSGVELMTVTDPFTAVSEVGLNDFNAVFLSEGMYLCWSKEVRSFISFLDKMRIPLVTIRGKGRRHIPSDNHPSVPADTIFSTVSDEHDLKKLVENGFDTGALK